MRKLWQQGKQFVALALAHGIQIVVQIAFFHKTLLRGLHCGEKGIHPRIGDDLGDAVNSLLRADCIVHKDGPLLKPHLKATLRDAVGVVIIERIIAFSVAVGQNERRLQCIPGCDVGGRIFCCILRDRSPAAPGTLIRQSEVACAAVEREAKRIIFQNVLCLIALG